MSSDVTDLYHLKMQLDLLPNECGGVFYDCRDSKHMDLRAQLPSGPLFQVDFQISILFELFAGYVAG